MVVTPAPVKLAIGTTGIGLAKATAYPPPLDANIWTLNRHNAVCSLLRLRWILCMVGKQAWPFSSRFPVATSGTLPGTSARFGHVTKTYSILLATKRFFVC